MAQSSTERERRAQLQSVRSFSLLTQHHSSRLLFWVNKMPTAGLQTSTRYMFNHILCSMSLVPYICIKAFLKLQMGKLLNQVSLSKGMYEMRQILTCSLRRVSPHFGFGYILTYFYRCQHAVCVFSCFSSSFIASCLTLSGF